MSVLDFEPVDKRDDDDATWRQQRTEPPQSNFMFVLQYLRHC